MEPALPLHQFQANKLISGVLSDHQTQVISFYIDMMAWIVFTISHVYRAQQGTVS